MTTIYPYILSGGAGTRLWPLSRKSYPKQFLKLLGDTSLLQQSCLRVDGEGFGAPTLLCHNDHRFLVAEQLREIGISPAAIVLEPVARNTAPPALMAALMASEQDPDSLVLVMPSDHVIDDIAGFQRSIKRGTEAALAGQIVVFGVVPDAPETGYGYIETVGFAAEQDEEVLKVRGFVEKPDLATAQAYLDHSGYFWNAGLFLVSARTLYDAFRRNAPELVPHCETALNRAVADLDYLRLDEKAFAQCENISLDYAVVEKHDAICCVPLETSWSDLGAWSSVWQQMEKDQQNNVTRGDVILHDVYDSYAHSEGGMCLAVVGLDNVMVVATKDAVLVAAKDKAQSVSNIVENLADQGREQAVAHNRVYRPWGWYEGLVVDDRFQVKTLKLKCGAQLSLQSHHHRAEHWIVVSGTAEVTLDGKTFLLTENESTYIPIGAVHRLRNPGKVPAILIEVQSGPYLGEDDVVRYDDI